MDTQKAVDINTLSSGVNRCFSKIHTFIVTSSSEVNTSSSEVWTSSLEVNAFYLDISTFSMDFLTRIVQSFLQAKTAQSENRF